MNGEQFLKSLTAYEVVYRYCSENSLNLIQFFGRFSEGKDLLDVPQYVVNAVKEIKV